ncbi:MAG: hypothetical protein P1V18_01515 [Candidatus Gracilibacteria bacterium]|nr:hypothetical protein [Candidatus Gracilibacteria bacterium]
MEETKNISEENSASNSPHKIFMDWVCPAYLQPEKGIGWYIMMGLIVLGFVIYGMMSTSGQYGWIVSITFLLMAGVYYLSQMTTPPIVKVEVTDHGIRFGAKFYNYGNIKSFWVIDNDDIKTLNFVTSKGSSRITILIPIEMNRAELKAYLVNFIVEEEGKEESFSDQLIRNLGL